jgi:hypothetical protein
MHLQWWLVVLSLLTTPTAAQVPAQFKILHTYEPGSRAQPFAFLQISPFAFSALCSLLLQSQVSMANVRDKLYLRANDKADKRVQWVQMRSEGASAAYYICIVEGAEIDDLSGLDGNIAKKFSNDFKKVSAQEHAKRQDCKGKKFCRIYSTPALPAFTPSSHIQPCLK